MANSTFNVEGYVTKDSLPFLENQLSVTLTYDSDYRSWGPAKEVGTRGDTFVFKTPTRTRTKTGITFDQLAAGEGDFSERIMPITANQQDHTNYQYTNVEEALFDRKGLLSYNNRSNLIELGTRMEQFSVTQGAFTGYRAFGDFSVQDGQMQTVGEVTDAVATYQTFGDAPDGYYVIPLTPAAKIAQSSLQQFVPARNDKVALKGDLGNLGGVENMRFIKSNVIPIHTAGTAADNAQNLGAGYEISSIVVTPPSNDLTGNSVGTTTINLASMPNDGDTFVVNDMIDIGFNSTSPLRFLSFTGYVTSENTVQGRVITGGTVAGGTVQIVIEPSLIVDDGIDVNANINRAIVTGSSGDKLRVAKSHRAAPIYIGNYGKFVAPKLPTMEDLKSGAVESPNGISLRMYYGDGIIGTAKKWVVHDVIYGFKGLAEGFGRVLYPLK